MPRSRHILPCLIVFGLLAMLAPAAAVATCGAGSGSAGDQQYVDPLAHCNKGGGSSSSSTRSSPAPTTTAPVSGTVTSPAPATTSPTTPPTTPATTPTATTAAGPTTTSKDPSSKSKTLPYTGYDSWDAAGLGLVLLAGGLGLRRRTQGS